MKTKIHNRSEGFTIIEVLLVLAIAALILLVVFLAVPSLQRNSKNTQLRSEAASITAAVQEYIGDHNGTPLKAASECGISDDCSTASSTAAEIMKLANVKDITALSIVATDQTIHFDSHEFNHAYVAYQSNCDRSNPASTGPDFHVIKGSGRSLAIVFAVENSKNETEAQCVDS